MEVDDAHQIFKSMVNGILLDRRVAMEQDERTVYRDRSVYDTVHKFLGEISKDVYGMLVDILKTLQGQGLVLYEATIAVFAAQETLEEQILTYVRSLLIQECHKELGITAPGEDSVAMD